MAYIPFYKEGGSILVLIDLQPSKRSLEFGVRGLNLRPRLAHSTMKTLSASFTSISLGLLICQMGRMLLLDKVIDRELDNMAKDNLFCRSSILISIVVIITMQRESLSF